MTRYPRAFIFDLDGIITDTAEFHYLAWKELGEELGVSIDRAFNEQLKGISRIKSLERILSLAPSLAEMTEQEKEKYATQKNDHFKKLIDKINSNDILPGIEVLLNKIKKYEIKVALGSASKNAPAVLEQLGLTNHFDYLVDAAKVTKGKPDPETFTTAAEALEVAYSDCVGIEDAQSGVEAINGAEMFSVGVGEQLIGADYKVMSTNELDFQKIIDRYQDWVSER
ncbi:beta-phosphoglucomutase [Radiobacillus sp. PE A8.2]|uniref:beta-phosphoglucomutase n=1 Tax=Radiobacillus sp. PE A8.2 TaxID=3380349 RepID=UPI00388F9617